MIFSNVGSRFFHNSHKLCIHRFYSLINFLLSLRRLLKITSISLPFHIPALSLAAAMAALLGASKISGSFGKCRIKGDGKDLAEKQNEYQQNPRRQHDAQRHVGTVKG